MTGSPGSVPGQCPTAPQKDASSEPKHEPLFNGLIQHSFAMRIPSEFHPQYTRSDVSDLRELLTALLSVPDGPGGDSGFKLVSVADITAAGGASGQAGGSANVQAGSSGASDQAGSGGASDQAACKGESGTPGGYSLLVSGGITPISPLGLPFSGRAGVSQPDLPAAFKWARSEAAPSDCVAEPWEGFITAQKNMAEPDAPARPNDFLVVEDVVPVPGAAQQGTQQQGHNQPAADAPEAISRLLCQLLGHRRSRLFGPSLAGRIFNVLLPHAIMSPSPLEEGDQKQPSYGLWVLQPALSLFSGDRDRGVRPVFTLTLFMVPVEDAGDGAPPGLRFNERSMLDREIYESVQVGWSLASSRPPLVRPTFLVSGPLVEYVHKLDQCAPEHWTLWKSANLRSSPACDGRHRLEWDRLTLRQVTEASLYPTVVRMVQGPAGMADRHTREEIGERVLTSLSASRVSSVVVVDHKLKKPDAERRTSSDGDFPGSLKSLMQAISGTTRIAPRRRYRLDRFFFDDDGYAIGVLPAARCMVVTSDADAQLGYLESGLMQAGWIAYMVIGAATAIGLMRSIYFDIEKVSRSKPSGIASIEREVVVDLHEIYDLDITWEMYRHRYRLLRDRLGITRDYQALQSKLQALYRETSTRFEDTAQVRLIWLTAAIVLLTFAVVIVTVLHK
jgi:hypothetical protein